MKHVYKEIMLFIFLVMVIGCNNKKSEQADLIFLDFNKDGVINPYEALDVLLVMQDEVSHEITTNEIGKMIEIEKKKMMKN